MRDYPDFKLNLERWCQPFCGRIAPYGSKKTFSVFIGVFIGVSNDVLNEL